ncbi:hypothetical protein GHA10_00555 [Escherichia coli]|nr:hypothetical protein [Escherichia coli]
MNNNQGRFVFPDTWFGPLLGEFEEVLDAYDTDEISETAYSALFDHGLASKSDQRFASIRSTGNLTFSTAF